MIGKNKTKIILVTVIVITLLLTGPIITVTSSNVKSLEDYKELKLNDKKINMLYSLFNIIKVKDPEISKLLSEKMDHLKETKLPSPELCEVLFNIMLGLYVSVIFSFHAVILVLIYISIGCHKVYDPPIPNSIQEDNCNYCLFQELISKSNFFI